MRVESGWAHYADGDAADGFPQRARLGLMQILPKDLR